MRQNTHSLNFTRTLSGNPTRVCGIWFAIVFYLT